MENNEEMKKFNFPKLSEQEQAKEELYNWGNLSQDKSLDEKKLKEELKNEGIGSFSLDQSVKKYRGHQQVEEADFRKEVQEAVEKELAQIREKAYQQGLEEGKAEALAAVKSKEEEALEQKMEEFTAWLQELKEDKSALLEKSAIEAVAVVRKLTEWVLDKEIDENEYLYELSLKLLGSLDSLQSIVIKANDHSVGILRDRWDEIEEAVGKVNNIRFIRDDKINGPGMIIEAHDLIVDGSYENIKSSLDKIFTEITQNIDSGPNS